jgi:hypothetical protein
MRLARALRVCDSFQPASCDQRTADSSLPCAFIKASSRSCRVPGPSASGRGADGMTTGPFSMRLGAFFPLPFVAGGKGVDTAVDGVMTVAGVTTSATLATQVLKNPYHFDFLGLGDEALERDIEAELSRDLPPESPA